MKILIVLFLIGCGSYPSNDPTPLPPTTSVNDMGEVCLVDDQMCISRSECCSNMCEQKDGWWYGRCIPQTLHSQSLIEIERPCYHSQWDACKEPPSSRNLNLINPVR